MAGFKFRLRKILEHRETLENIKKGEFGKIQTELNKQREILESLKSKQTDILTEKASKMNTTMYELQIYNNYILELDRQIEMQMKKIEEIKIEVEKARSELIEATKDKKIIEKLKLRDYQEFLYEEKKIEEKANDQFVSYSSSINAMED